MSLIAANLDWVQALGWSLLHFVWQGLAIGAVFALARAMVPSEHSSIRYAIGLAALLMLAMCPVLTLWMLLPQAASMDVGSVGDAAVMQAMTLPSAVVVDSGAALGNLLPWLVLVWMAGVSFMIWRAVHQWRALERIATRLAHRRAEIEEMLVRVAERFGGMPQARVLISGFIDTPTLIGWFKPVILLPAAVVTGFPREQLELILAHELGHLRRYDHLVNLGQAVIETLLFYHPVVHWISREVRHEREICCDNLVLRLTDSEPREYARTLAALETVRHLTPQLAVAASGGILLDRVRRIIGSPHRSHAGRRSALVSWLVAAAGSSVIVGAVLVSHWEREELSTRFDQPSLPDAAVERTAIKATTASDLAAPIRFARLELPTVAAADILLPASPTGELNATTPAAAQVTPTARPALATPQRPVAILATPVQDSAIGPAPVAIDVADLTMVDAPEVAAPADIGLTRPARRPASLPSIVRMVSPNYPDNGVGASHVKVGFEFSIDGDGKVHDVNMVSGNKQSGFADAARRALRQWRFDPRSLQASAGEKFRQDFEFVSGSQANNDDDDAHCTPPTGSHVCRPGRGVSVTMKIDSEQATSQQTLVLAGGGSN